MPLPPGQIVVHREDLVKAIKEGGCFDDHPNLTWSLEMPEARPAKRKYRHWILKLHPRKDRAFIYVLFEDGTSNIALTASSAHELLKKVQGGWKYQPIKKEGLFQ